MPVRQFDSEIEARRYALEKGATVAGPSGRFNAKRERVIVSPPPSPPPLPAPLVEQAIALPEFPGGTTDAAKAVDRQTVALSRLFFDLKESIQAAALLGPVPADEWIFDIERDDNGCIKRVIAKAVRPKLN